MSSGLISSCFPYKEFICSSHSRYMLNPLYCDTFDHLLGNGYVNTFQSVTRIDVHCYTTDLVTRELEAFPWQRIHKEQSRTLEGGDFYAVRGVYKKGVDSWIQVRKSSRVEAGSNTSSVTLRVVGGDEKGSLEESETVKYGQASHGSRTRKILRWRGPGAIVNDRPVLSLERTSHINKPATVWQ
jgi:hypothetical protein